MRVAFVVVAALALAPAALGGTVIDRAVAALRDDPVYVDAAAAKTISATEAERLRAEIRTKGDGPIYVAVLPDAALSEAGGAGRGVVGEIARGLARPGVYAVVAGGQFRAVSTDLGKRRADELASKAFEAHRSEGIEATLLDFVDRVGDRRRHPKGGGRGGLGGIGFFPLLLIAGAIFFVYKRFQRRRAAAVELAAVKETAREDLVALADDVGTLEHEVERDPEANRAYLAALDQYAKASSSFDRAASPQQLQPVAEALEEGRYEMAVARARLDGNPVPERRSACFFDPRHGPSVRDVEWSPPGGRPREVPACAADAIRLEAGEEPESRNVLVGGRQTPYWAAGPMYGSYFGGFFPGLLLGELLVGGFGGFGGGFGGYGGYGSDGSGGDGGGGDFGGDFGGGDFGGGDGGGGDF